MTLGFKDDFGNEYRYEIGGADASELNASEHTIDMTSNVEINTGTHSADRQSYHLKKRIFYNCNCFEQYFCSNCRSRGSNNGTPR